MEQIRGRLISQPWLVEMFTLLGAILYIVQTWRYSFIQDTILDEGAYLLKGYLFATGQYTIFQDNGVWSNHMPLAFLIPGVIQVIFGPGLRTARYFSVFISILILLGLWLVTRRERGRWWAAGAVWALAWNPALVKMYSVGVSQGLIACMFVWSLYFVLGEKRTLWQISLGAVLAGAMFMTRINMAPILPLLVFYVLWQHGVKAAGAAALSGGLVVGIGHAIYWPNILRLWAYWLPESITPFLNTWRLTEEAGVRFWHPDLSLARRVASFFHSFRFQFIPLMGALGAWLLWPKRKAWQHASDFRVAIYLSGLFAALWLAHLWATMGNEYCVYCLAGYIAFFNSASLLVVSLSFSIWLKEMGWFRQLGIGLILLIISTGIGFSAFEDIGNTLANLRISRFFLGAPAQWRQTSAVGEIIINIFHINQQQLIRYLPATFGFGAGVILLVAAGIISILSPYPAGQRKYSFGYWAVLIFISVGAIFTPTTLFSGGYQTYYCGGNVIRSQEIIGEHLASVIPAGSRVYWRGRLSAVPLLYIPDVRIFPAQINGDYTIYQGGDSERLEKFGFWNEDLAQQWANEADFILIARHYYDGWLKDFVNAGQFDELESTPQTAHCEADAQIRIFRRKQ